MLQLTIIGTGHLASAITKLYRDYYAGNTFELRILTHSPAKVGQCLYSTLIEEFDTNILQVSTVVLLAIPADKTLSWVEQYGGFLNNKILIDCSNKIGNGKKIYNLVQEKGCAVIKAFTAINVFHITDSRFSITESSNQMVLAGNDDRALSIVSELVRALGFIPKQIPSIEASELMEIANCSNFSKWHYPLVASAITWLFYGIYAVFERNVLQGQPWHNQGIQNMNVAFACNALTQFGLVYGAGAVAQIKQDLLGRALTATTDKYLVGSLDRRKQLGLIAMFNLCTHVTISLLLFGSTYYEYFSQDTDDATSLTDAATVSFIGGVLGYMGYSLISLTSLPSIAKELGMIEWRTIQSYLGWSALALATTHVLAMSYQNLLTNTQSNKQIPSSFLLSVVTPCLALAAKITSVFTHCFRRYKPFNSQPVTIEVIDEEAQSAQSFLAQNTKTLEAYNRYGTFGSGRNKAAQKPLRSPIEPMYDEAPKI
jgi:predicted dinucleotide-binding enzyme/DMSO/TMAO reductase YedYZ heme-binding membrane subunit